MKPILFTTVILLAFLTLANAQPPLRIPNRYDLPPSSFPGVEPPENDLWPKLYGGYESSTGDDIEECYDKAYLISGNLIDNVGWKTMPFLMKTDVNGTVLWEKRISYLGNSGAVYPEIYTYGIWTNTCRDGGFLIAGGTTAIEHCYDYECTDGWVMKLNPCGEKEWCRIIRTPGSLDYAMEAIERENGEIWVLVDLYGYDRLNKRIWIFCLDNQGELLWKKVYCQYKKNYNNEFGFSMMPLSGNRTMMFGDCYIVDSVSNPGWYSYYIEPFHMMLDSLGDEIWAESWSYDYTKYCAEVHGGCEDVLGHFWTTAKMIRNPGITISSEPGGLFRTLKNGTPAGSIVFLDHMVPFYGVGRVNSVVSLDTNLLFTTHIWGVTTNPYVQYMNAQLSDTLGLLLKEQELMVNGFLTKSILTSDRKIASVGGVYINSLYQFDAILYKFTDSLDFAPLDTRPLVYDSLCPHPIVSDTIKLDCGIIVGTNDLPLAAGRPELQIYPNPATTRVRIQLPETWATEATWSGGIVQTVHYKWPTSMEVHFLDSGGHTLLTLPWPRGASFFDAEISSLPKGLFVVRVTSNNRELATGKVLVTK